MSNIKTLLSISMIVFVGYSLPGCTPKHEPSELFRVMSFNIRFDNPDDGPNAWSHRKDFVASMFRFHHTDIIGTQEGLLHQLEYLDEELPEFSWVGTGRDPESDQNEHCAIYYRSDRFELLDDGTFWLSETPDRPGVRGWDADLPRIVTWVRIRDKRTLHSFVVLNTHFDHRGQQARIESSRLMLRKAKEISDDAPIIIMGDINAREESEPYKMLTMGDGGLVTLELQDGLYASKYGHHGPTASTNGFSEIRPPNTRIDYIFVDTGVSVIQHGIVADQRNGLFPSDHLPVLADLKITGN